VLGGLPGVELRDARAAKINVKDGRVTGVTLAGGEELAAALVLSGASPQRTLLQLTDPAWLDPELLRALGNLRARGVVARVSVRLDRPGASPPCVMAPSLDYLERAYDHAKYGRFSQEPYMEVHCAGDTAEVAVQYAPYRLAEAQWDDALRHRIGEAAKGFVGRVAAGAVVQEASVLAPPELEAQFGWPEGQADHVELTLDQALWARPLPELACYRTPVSGLWLCGPASHPAPGIAGAAGYLCVREIRRG
jgi:phytoene dehydrogenase-like protein